LHHNKLKIVSLLFPLQVFSFWLIAQSPFYINYGTKDGLPSAEIYDVAIDNQGLIWFTSDRGVSTYDGYGFSTYSTQDGLSNNTNFEIFEDDEGLFWFTGFDGSLSYFENGKFHVFQHNDSLKSTTKGRWVTSFIHDGENIVFSQLQNISGEYYTININTGEIKTNSIKTNANFHSNNAYGNTYVTRIGKHSLFYSQNLIVSSDVLPLQNGNQSLVNSKGLVFLLDNQSIRKIDLPWAGLADYSYQDIDSHIWLCTSKGLLLYKDGDLEQIPQKYFEGLSISSIIMDKEGNYWVSSLEKGVFFIPSFSIQQYIFDPTPPTKERIMSIGILPRHILFGTSNGRLFILNNNKKDKSIKHLTRRSQLRTIYTKGNLAYAQSQVLTETKHNKIIATNAKSHAICNWQMYNGLFFHALSTGFKIMSEEEDYLFVSKYASSSISQKRIMTIEEDENRHLLLGTSEGLYRLDPDNHENIEDITNASPLLKIRISDIKKMPNNSRWIATIGNGLLYQNKDTVFQFGEEDGLNSNLINKIVTQGDSILWIATNKGLNKLEFHIQNSHPQASSIQGFTTADGLLSNFVNDLAIWNDEVWLALDNGINHFKPADLQKRKTAPRISLDSVEVLNTKLTIDIKDDLASDQNDIVFHFKGICFSKPESKSFYRYKLSSNQSESNWYYTNDRSARFTNLPVGNYHFTVTARNNNDVWAKPTTPFPFRILPHYTNTFWFKTLIASAVMLFIFLVTFLRNRQLLQERELQEALYNTKDAQLSALRSQMNPHFVFNSLNAIQNYIFKNDVEVANYYLARFSKLIRNSLEFSKLEYISLRQEIDFIKTYMELEQMRFPDKFDFHINIDEQIEQNINFIPPLLLQPVLENAVKYAFKHCDYKGIIKLQIKEYEKGNTILVCIEDNGSGILDENNTSNTTLNKEHRSFGLEIIKDRITLLNEDQGAPSATFKHYNKETGSGLRAEFIFPIRLPHNKQ
jgi:ligand-binding sensor domain-containing protein